MKDTSQLNFTSLEDVKRRFDPAHDKCKEKPSAFKRYTLSGNVFPYKHRRPLPEGAAQEALKYIRAISAQYPFQLRYHLALPYWYRFSEAWCESGDEGKALRAI